MSKKNRVLEKRIKKPSAMIQINVKNLTLTQRKIVNFLIYIAQKEGDRKLYHTDVQTLKDLCMIKSTESVDLKEQFEHLKDISIEFNYLDKDKNAVWEIMSLVSSARIIFNTGQVRFEIPYMLREKILNPNIYAPLNILLIAGLKSKYAIILYELLRDYLTAPFSLDLSIERFRALLGLEADQYKLFKDFRKWVLDKAINEINTKTDIHCSYVLVKEGGNKYTRITFDIRNNKQFKLSKHLSPPLEENIRLLPDKFNIPQEILNTIPEKYRVTEVFQIIAPHLDQQDMLVSNIRYTDKKHKENFVAYLRKALQEDYAKSAREVQGNIDRAEAEKEEQAMLEAHKREEEKKRVEAVIAWREQASPALLLQIQERATQEVREEHPVISKNFLGIPTRIRTDEIIVSEYLEKPQEPEQEELVLFELEQDS